MITLRERFATMRLFAVSAAESAATAREANERERSKASRRRRELAAHRPGEPGLVQRKNHAKTSLFAAKPKRSDAKFIL